LILAIDSATETLGIALADRQRVHAERIWRSNRHHTIELAPAVALMLRESSLQAEELRAVAVATGPGSYTGLRIGMGFAKGIALAAGIPIVGVPTLEILASAQSAAQWPLLAVLKAGRGRIAAVWYKWRDLRWLPDTEPRIFTWEEAINSLDGPTIICGEIGEMRGQLQRQKYVTLASPAECLRRPSFLAELAHDRLGDPGSETAALAPIYLGAIEARED
jgi:tRNA threonylcarbamoyladenosine biosynthesis protein TsaB